MWTPILTLTSLRRFPFLRREVALDLHGAGDRVEGGLKGDEEAITLVLDDPAAVAVGRLVHDCVVAFQDRPKGIAELLDILVEPSMSEKRKLTVPRGRSPEFIIVTNSRARPLPAALFGRFQVRSRRLAGGGEAGPPRDADRIEVESAEHSVTRSGPSTRSGRGDVLDTDMSVTEVQRRTQSALEDVLGPAGERDMSGLLRLVAGPATSSNSGSRPDLTGRRSRPFGRAGHEWFRRREADRRSERRATPMRRCSVPTRESLRASASPAACVTTSLAFLVNRSNIRYLPYFLWAALPRHAECIADLLPGPTMGPGGFDVDRLQPLGV